MRGLKSLALACAAIAAGLTTAVMGADYRTAEPPPSYERSAPIVLPELRGTISSGIYLRGDVGIGLVGIGNYDQEDVRRFNGTFIAKESQTSAFSGGVGVGFRFNKWFRVDGTLEYRGGSSIGATDYIFNPFANGYQTNTYKGSLSSMVGLINGYAELGTWNFLTPYVGAGIGYAYNQVTGLTDQGIVYSNQPAGPITPTLATAATGSSGNLAWSLMAGVGYEVNENLTLEVGYRYLNLGNANSGRLTNAFLNENYGPLKLTNIDTHELKVGMRWNFGEPTIGTKGHARASYTPASYADENYAEPAYATASPMIRKY